jgi:hypothetical protein
LGRSARLIGHKRVPAPPAMIIANRIRGEFRRMLGGGGGVLTQPPYAAATI